jgi:phosphatidate cytidylyltransferase
MGPPLAKINLQTFANVNFYQRVGSALVIAPLVLFAVYYGGWIYPLIITLIMALGLREWLRLIDPLLPRNTQIFAYVSLVIMLGLGATLSPAFGAMLGVVLMLVLFLMAARDSENRAAWIALGLPYMGGSGLAMLYLRAVPGSGRELIYYLLAVVWGTDIGAYLVGKIVGGPKLAPTISPGKTWAGFFGGMALAVILGYAVALSADLHPAWLFMLLALPLSGMSQAGDLFKSYFKRRAGVKESGSLIPGHGGVLDRIDGLVFAAVFFALFQIAVPMQ